MDALTWSPQGLPSQSTNPRLAEVPCILEKGQRAATIILGTWSSWEGKAEKSQEKREGKLCSLSCRPSIRLDAPGISFSPLESSAQQGLFSLFL